ALLQLSFYFPNLTLYGTGFQELFAHPVFPSDLETLSSKSPSFTLLLHDVLSTVWSQPGSCVDVVKKIQGRKIRRTMMGDTWGDLESRLQSTSKDVLAFMLDYLREIFAIFCSTTEFCDREGIPLRDVKFQQEQRWIEFIRGEDTG
ncbi:2778_t:CDS:1, partial [Acaulospora colombiana]